MKDPCTQWEWRNYFIKLSDLIGEGQTKRDMPRCHMYLIQNRFAYPLKHKMGTKEYLFEYNSALQEVTFKTYEDEPYLYKGRLYNANNP